MMEEWNDKNWKVTVRERYDGESCYDLNAPSTTYVFNEHDFLQLAHNINSIAEHIYDKEYYYIHDGNIFKRTGGQLVGVIDDCEELNKLYKACQKLRRTITGLKQGIKELEIENKELKQQNRQLSLVGEKQAKFIQSKGFDVHELIDFARNDDND